MVQIDIKNLEKLQENKDTNVMNAEDFFMKEQNTINTQKRMSKAVVSKVLNLPYGTVARWTYKIGKSLDQHL